MQNTLVFATGAAAIAIVFGVMFAWLVERTNIRGKTSSTRFFLYRLLSRGFYSRTRILLLSPGAGMINLALKNLLRLNEAPLALQSQWNDRSGRTTSHACYVSDDGGILSAYGSFP